MAPPRKPRQIVFDLGHHPAQSRDDLVVSPANAEAVAAVDRWPDWPAPVLVVAGPDGSGKTHLAAVWRETAGAAALDASHLDWHGLDEPMPPVVIDDADRENLDEAGLFHLLNNARAAGSHVLLTALRPPAAWRTKLPDLASRLRLAAVATLETPDDALLAGVLMKLFADRQVEVDPPVVQFVLRRIDRSLAAAARAVEALDRAAMEAKSPVTRALAAAVIGAEADREG